MIFIVHPDRSVTSMLESVNVGETSADVIVISPFSGVQNCMLKFTLPNGKEGEPQFLDFKRGGDVMGDGYDGMVYHMKMPAVMTAAPGIVKVDIVLTDSLAREFVANTVTFSVGGITSLPFPDSAAQGQDFAAQLKAMQVAISVELSDAIDKVDEAALKIPQLVINEICPSKKINLSQYNFSIGGISAGNNNTLNTRCSTHSFIPIAQNARIFIRVSEGYKLEVDFYDNYHTYLGYEGWLTENGEVRKPAEARYVKVAIASTNDTVITPDVALDAVEVAIGNDKTDGAEIVRKMAEEKDFFRLYNVYGTTFHYEEFRAEKCLYVKFGRVNVRGFYDGIWFAKTYTNDDIATQCGTTLATSPSGVDECIIVKDEDALLYDLSSKNFLLVHRGSIDGSTTQIPLVLCEGGKPIYFHPSLALDILSTKISAEEEEVTTVSIPSYWESALTTAQNKIKQHQNDGGVDTFTFGFITDTHVSSAADGAFAKLMEQVLDTCDIPLFLHGGDIVEGTGIISKEELIDQILHHEAIFQNIEDKCLLAFGNHDSSYGVLSNYDSALTDGEIYNYIFRKDRGKDSIVFGETGRYFYKDVPAQKARYIVLDCYDFETALNENTVVSNNKMSGGAKFGAKQLQWLADVALNVPEEFSVILCSHQPPYRESDKNAIGWTGEDCLLDAEVAVGIVNAYRNKSTYSYSGTLGTDTSEEVYDVSVDFTQYAGGVVCWVAGHTHKDYIFDIDGLKVVSTANCSLHQSTNPVGFAPEKASGSDTEYAMDFLCVNKATKTCNIVRLGASLPEYAEGRSFSYENASGFPNTSHSKRLTLGEGCEALTDGSVAIGENVVAGSRGFYVQSINSASQTISVKLCNPITEKWANMPDIDSGGATDTIPSLVGYYFSFINGTHYAFCGTITRVEVGNETAIIYYDPTTVHGTVLSRTDPWWVLDESGTMREDWANHVLWIPECPHLGYDIVSDDGRLLFENATAMGNQCCSSADSAFVVGEKNTAGGDHAAVFGAQNRGAYGNIISGRENLSTGLHSALLGRLLYNHGDYNFLAGYKNTINENYSCVIGSINIVNGRYSAAVGRSHVVDANAATAFGWGNNIKHNYAFAAGNGLISHASMQALFGSYNAADAEAIVIVGSGNKTTSRKNAFSVGKFGTRSDVDTDGVTVKFLREQLETKLIEGAW